MLHDGISSRLYCEPELQVFRLNSVTHFGLALAEMLCRD